MHQCSVCQKGFPSASKLQRHYLIHTGQKPFICLVCGKAFRQSVHLKKHNDTHTVNFQNWSNNADSLQHPIPVPTNLDPTHEISGHCNLITGTTPLPTVSFYKDGSTQRTQPEIYSTCSDTKPQSELITLEDNSCFISEQSTLPGRHYFTSLMLQDNMGSDGMDNSVWHTDDIHTCTVCLMCFSSSQQLQRHLPVHTQPKPFECSICGKTFRLRAHLKMHSQIHDRRSTGLFKTIPMLASQHSSSRLRMRVNHECPTCSKTFCSPSKLKRHFLTHTGQKPFSCEVCGKNFRQVSHLKTHLYASHHESNHESKCSKIKDNPLDTKNNTNVEIQCEISVSAPQKQETETNSPLPVKVEPNTNGNSPFQCSICSKTFTSSIRHRQHYMNHKEVRPFECLVCGRAFRLSTHLKRHQISHRTLDTTQSMLLLNSPSKAVSLSKIEHVYPTSEKIMTSPEPNESKPLELNIIVKPEHWKPNMKDDEDLPSVTTQNTESTVPSQMKMPGSSESNNRRNTISQKTKNQPLNHHQCVACLKSFPSPSKLQRHMLTHTGQRPYGCHTCGKRFRQLTHLRIHSRTHVWSRNGKTLDVHRSRTPCQVTECGESPTGVEFQEKLPEKGDSDGCFEVSSPTERQSGQGSVFSYEHNESNRKRQWIQCSTSSPSKPPLPLQIPPETINCGNIQLKNQVKPEGKLHNDPNQNTAPHLAMDGRDGIPVGNTSHTKHQCLLCFKNFPCASKLQRHNLVHTGLRPFQCLACGKTFRQATHLKVHQRTHIKWNPFRPASRQGIRLKIRRQQQLHYPKVRVQVPVASSIKAEPSLSESPIESRPFQDNVEDTFNNRAPSQQDDNINKTYTQPVQISLSKLNNSSPTRNVTCGKRKAHLCTVCQKGFDTPSKLSRHFLIHTGVRPFKCTLCTKTFRQPCHLRSHEQRAHVNRNFSGFQDSCIVPDLEHLASAQGKTVTDVTQSYKDNSGYCPVTDESLGHCSTGETKFVAVQEIPDNSMDSGSKHCEDYWCTERPSNFLSSPEIAASLAGHRHVGNVETTGQTLLQQEMGSQMHSIQLAFQTNQVLADEDSGNVIENEGLDPYWREPVHTAFQCDTCIAYFETEKDLQLHKCVSINQIEVTQSSPYQCAICFKDFKTPSKLQRHYVTHTGERPFQCKACDKTFTQASHLKTHQRTHK